MKSRQYRLFGLLFLVVMFTAAGCITLSGRITVKGNEPHTYVVLVAGESEEYVIVGDLAETLRKEYQNKRVRVKGKIVGKAIPGKPAELEVFEILEVLDKQDM
jgi:hypothetical protein